VVRRPNGIIRWYGLLEDGESLIHRKSSLFINKVNVSTWAKVQLMPQCRRAVQEDDNIWESIQCPNLESFRVPAEETTGQVSGKLKSDVILSADSTRSVVPSMSVEMLQFGIYPISIVLRWCTIGLVEDGQHVILVHEGYRHEERCEKKVGIVILAM
jgi:hypothetical protein